MGLTEEYVGTQPTRANWNFPKKNQPALAPEGRSPLRARKALVLWLTPWRQALLAGLGAWLLALPWQAQAFDGCRRIELNINGLSKHFYKTKRSERDGWNEVNYGLGLTCQLRGVGRWDDEVEAGYYSNSHFIQSNYIAYGLYYPLTDVISAGVRIGVVSGYKTVWEPSGISVGPVPTVKLKLSERYTLNLTLIPKDHAFLFVNLGIGF